MVVLKHPVYCVNVVGTQNANNLISISTDGKMCSWSLDMLSQPQVTDPLKPEVRVFSINCLVNFCVRADLLCLNLMDCLLPIVQHRFFHSVLILVFVSGRFFMLQEINFSCSVSTAKTPVSS